MEKKLALDTAALERSYHQLSRKLHPDRFASSGVRVRDASLRATALLTRSYRTLRDPVSRGRYWLELNGEKLGENNKSVPPDLAEMVFDVQEQLTELRTAGQAVKPALLDQLSERRAALQSSIDSAHEELRRNFQRWDSNSGEKKPLIAELKSILSKIAYLRTLVRDVDRELENARAA
ncbi:MAG TPA: Fe-S protein assembly co-chaperone HscB [Candidatus Binataceae bacterium]